MLNSTFLQHFVEKFDAGTAPAYLSEGGCYWSADMFDQKVSIWLKQRDQFRPGILQATQAVWGERSAGDKVVRSRKIESTPVPAESGGCAAIECSHVCYFAICGVPLDVGWNVLGARAAIRNALPKFSNSNAHLSDMLPQDSQNISMHPRSMQVRLVGVKELNVAEAPDARWVEAKHRSQNVKYTVTQSQKIKHEEHPLYPKVRRPWGSCGSIDDGFRFAVNRIQAA